MTAVVRARTPAAVAAVDQRRLVAVAKQPVKPHAPAARAEVVADGVTVLATTTARNSLLAMRLVYKHVNGYPKDLLSTEYA